MKVSKRIQDLKVSPIRKLTPYKIEAEKKGLKVIGFNIGQPDIKTPKEFFDAIKNFDDEILSYANSQGVKEFINSTIEYLSLIHI